MTKRTALRIFAAPSAALLLFHGACSRPVPRPNLVLVSIDTLRADHLHCYGYGKDVSPFLDSVARRGILFRNTIAQANWTLPSHVSMLTSLYPAVHRVQNGTDKMPDSLLTLAEILSAEGYSTAAFVDGGVMSHKFGFDQGFGLYDDRSKGRDKDRKVVGWVREHRKGPFFLFYHTYDVHYPYRHHPRSRSAAGEKELEEFARRINARDFSFTDEELARGIVAWYTDPGFYRMIGLDKVAPMKREMESFMKERWKNLPGYRRDLDFLLEAYDGGISFADARIGRLWRELETLGVGDRTLLVITSDHGECFLEHGALGHPALLYDEIVRVPLLILYPPLGRKGLEVESQVMSVDILPTALDILGVPAPPNIQGESLLSLITGPGGAAERPAFSDAEGIQSVRAAGWKLIAPASGKKGPTELYDLREDPGETRNRADSAPAERRRLEALARERAARDAALSSTLGLTAPRGKVSLDEKTLGELKALGYLQ